MVEALSIGSVTFDMIYNILRVIGIGVFAVALFFGTRFFQKYKKKSKQFKTTAIIVSRTGVVNIDKVAYLKNNDNMILMEMKKRKQDKIPPVPFEFVRSNQVMLFNYAPGQYAPVHPDTWTNIDLKKFNIKLLNNNMKNFMILEQRAAAHRWAQRQDKIKQLTPWITLGIVAIAAAVISWFILKTASYMFLEATSKRFAECQSVVPTYEPPIPTG